MRLSNGRRALPTLLYQLAEITNCAENGSGQKFLVTESFFRLDGDRALLREYAALCGATETALILDEAHAVGICGNRTRMRGGISGKHRRLQTVVAAAILHGYRG
jgi:7-keto-8-aminopelargonate synthetase-like enzyme